LDEEPPPEVDSVLPVDSLDSLLVEADEEDEEPPPPHPAMTRLASAAAHRNNRPDRVEVTFT
jgi:hypothetical protein